MRHLEDHTTIACSQLTDLLKVIILQLPNLLFLGEERLQALALLLIQLQLLQLLLQGLQVGPAPQRRAGVSRAGRGGEGTELRVKSLHSAPAHLVQKGPPCTVTL